MSDETYSFMNTSLYIREYVTLYQGERGSSCRCFARERRRGAEEQRRRGRGEATRIPNGSSP
jgi:hypothetical protein